MIRLKQILSEMKQDDVERILEKIKNNEFRFFDQGDNGRVYEIEGEDKLFKITTESDEFKVASVIVGRYAEFSTFIPVYYVNEKRQLYIMAKAERLNSSDTRNIDQFMESYKQYAREQGGEVSIFDYLDAEGGREHDQELVTFIRALQTDIGKMGISDLDLDLDFKTDNVMRWSNRLVLIDW
jgi:hypothetical protein